jgi:hypothetical protein
MDDATQPFPWLLAYFRQIYQGRVEQTEAGVHVVKLTDEEVQVEALHLAYSWDGFHWTALNGNQPVLTVSQELRELRDPFLRRGADGQFHLVATGGPGRDTILYSKSENLLTWDVPQAIPIMRGVPNIRNCWAPEFVFDEEQGNYLLFWSSSYGRHGWDDSRIWCARTEDFSSFSEPRVLFDAGFTVIDATIVPFNDRYFMFFKDERFGEVLGEHRAIRIAESSSLEGPYKIISEPITPVITEGPALARLPDGRWALYYDYCMDNRYGVAVSDDLLHWHEVKDASFPENARHGSILPVTREELERLTTRFAPD